MGASLALEEALDLLLGPTTELVFIGCHIKPAFNHVIIRSRNLLLLHRIREDNTSKGFDLWSAHEAPTYQAFSPFQFALNAK